MSKNPDAFRTISEVADELDLPQHVLRFWETKFSQIKPMKRAGGRRYYRPDDFELLQGIRHLLYDQGYTIKGVQKLLKQNGNKYVIALGAGDISTAESILIARNDDIAEEQRSVANGGERQSSSQMVGMAKTPSALRFLKRYNEENSAKAGAAPETGEDSQSGNQELSDGDRQLLQETLQDLLECKRLLDQTR